MQTYLKAQCTKRMPLRQVQQSLVTFKQNEAWYTPWYTTNSITKKTLLYQRLSLPSKGNRTQSGGPPQYAHLHSATGSVALPWRWLAKGPVPAHRCSSGSIRAACVKRGCVPQRAVVPIRLTRFLATPLLVNPPNPWQDRKACTGCALPNSHLRRFQAPLE